MNPRVLEAINRQINSELSASYAYLAMSAYLRVPEVHRRRTLAQASEPGREHARDEALRLRAGARPTASSCWRSTSRSPTSISVAEVFERALEQEQEVSRQIDALYETAFREGVRRGGRAPVVPHRAGGRGKDRARDRREVPDGRQRSRRRSSISIASSVRARPSKPAKQGVTNDVTRRIDPHVRAVRARRPPAAAQTTSRPPPSAPDPSRRERRSRVDHRSTRTPSSSGSRCSPPTSTKGARRAPRGKT